MVLVYTEIEIASSPEHVRKVFLDFPKYPEWSKDHFKSVEPHVQKDTLDKGDKLKVAMQGMTMNPVVSENTKEEFRWIGSLWPVFVGEHSFRFEPSKTTPGETTFIDSEEFTGILPWIMSPLYRGAQPSKNFEKFNEGLKKRVESLKADS